MGNIITTHYIIDMSSNNNFVQIPVMQGDGNDTRQIELELISNGTQYKIDTNNTIATISGTKADGKTIFNSCDISDNGYIIVSITYQMASCIGKSDYQIMLIDTSTNNALNSFPFHLVVTPSTYDANKIISSNEFQLLTQTIASVDSVTTEALEKINDITTLQVEINNSEEERKVNELTRISAENKRITSETNRETAEDNREKSSATAVQNANNAASIANTASANADASREATENATANANTATQKANTAIEEMKSLMKSENIVHTSVVGVPNGVATLDENGVIPSNQLPSFVDGTEEGVATNVTKNGTTGQFTATGFILVGESSECVPESGKIYVDINDNVSYRWTGSVFISLSGGVEIGTTSSSAFAGDRGLALEERMQAVEDYHNNIPASDIKFNNVNTPLLGANVQVAIEDLTKVATHSTDGLMSAADKTMLDNYANIQEIEAVLYASSWSGTEAPYSQIITIANLLDYNCCSIEISPNATSIEEVTMADANVTSITYDEFSGLTFIAEGVKPSINIPIVICVATSMNVVEVPVLVEGINTASNISYNNTSSGLTSVDAQNAIDEVSIVTLKNQSDIESVNTEIDTIHSNIETINNNLSYQNLSEKITSNNDKLHINAFYKENGTVLITGYLEPTSAGSYSANITTQIPRCTIAASYFLSSGNDVGCVNGIYLNTGGTLSVWTNKANVANITFTFCYYAKS